MQKHSLDNVKGAFERRKALREKQENLPPPLLDLGIRSIRMGDLHKINEALKYISSMGYGNSFTYVTQAANGTGAEELGSILRSTQGIVTIGFFIHQITGQTCAHIIRPIGFDNEEIVHLAARLYRLTQAPVFLKKLTSQEIQHLLATDRFKPVINFPWHSRAVAEDDTYPEAIVSVDRILRMAADRSTEIGYKQIRFRNRRGSNELTIREISEDNYLDALLVITEFFNYLEQKNLHISQPADYFNMVLVALVYPKEFLHGVLYLNGDPAGMFFGEHINEDEIGLYANISLYQQFKYLSEVLIVKFAELAASKGFKVINLGGSETEGLHKFKEKYSPVEQRQMHWLVYGGE